MNFSPEQMKMASEMMKNMKPEDYQNMLRTVQQNPEMVEQARKMMQGGPIPPFPSTSTSQVDKKFHPLDEIIVSKEKGNELFKNKDYQNASIKYLDCILDIESLREKMPSEYSSDQKFLASLNELEVSCRNNYSITKLHLEEYHLVVPQSEKVLLINPINIKALYNVGQAYFNLKEYENARISIRCLLNNLNGVKPDSKVLELKDKIDGYFKESGLNGSNFDESPKKSVRTNDKDDQKETPSTVKAEESNKKVNVDQPLKNENMLNSEILKNKEDQKASKLPKKEENVEKTKINDKSNDYVIKEESEFDEIEKMVMEKKKEEKSSTVLPEKQTNKTTNQQTCKKDCSHTHSSTQQNTTTLTHSENIFNRYWQVLLGILIGLIIGKIFSK